MNTNKAMEWWKMGLPPACSSELARIRADVGDCLRCPLHHGRRSLVFGMGPEDARLMVVGEAPGASEDRMGEPFVGKSGEVLDRLLMDAFGLKRSAVYLTNVAMCRPPGNRNPEHSELGRCIPFLGQKVAAVRPRAVLLVGSMASRAVLMGRPLSDVRGEVVDYVQLGNHRPRIVATYHPAYLCRMPDRYDDAVADARLLADVVATDERVG